MSDIEAKVTAQGNVIRELKSKKASKDEIKAAVGVLLQLKEEYKAATGKDYVPVKVNPKGDGKKKKKDNKGQDTGKGKKKAMSGNVRGAAVEMPEYIQHRMSIWDECTKKRAAEAAPKKKPIKVTVEGKEHEAVAFETTSLDLAKKIGGDALKATVAKVDGEMQDLQRTLNADCTVEFCQFDTPEGSHAFWHSSAHVLGQALEKKFKGAKLTIGPPLEDGGFYYDVHIPDEGKVSQTDYKDIQKLVNKVQKEKQPFVRLEVTKKEALDMFKYNPFKCQIISEKIGDNETCTAYRNGPLIDLCRGPHIPHTGLIKSMAVTKNSSAYWLGNAENESLQRVYGISFPNKDLMKEWKTLMAEADKRDHRRVGTQQKLFFFDDISPGSAFMQPHGTRLYNKLQEFIRGQYRVRGFQEVITPNVFNVDLWKQSGHWANYQENMFTFSAEGTEFGMKPMNCPGHCVMFSHTLRSYRELPLRLADFGVLHRNELSGALTGLTRVRRFVQDDAHIFARHDQIEQEVSSSLEFLQYVYGIFGFTFSLQLSTRPAKYLGEIEMWDKAEKALAACLDNFGKEWTINPADGAFYGPKIDIQLTDALKRKHQCATIQLDFQLPIRFNLNFKGSGDQFERPVIIHRAILGSVERMMAVLIEHTGGKWPFWLSPRQSIVISVGAGFNEYANKVAEAIHGAGFFVDVEDTGKQLPKKIRESQMMQYNYLLVVGPKELEAGTVTVRNRDDARNQHVLTIAQVIQLFKRLEETHS